MRELSKDRAITIAVLAIGGQGGGVLMNWITALAEGAGWRVQATSVPGVAQRTGATIYYLELLPPGERMREAVLSLMPVPGEVDIVIAAESMEAGRALQRGLINERTTVIASTHRAYSVKEKSVPGDGLDDGESVRQLVAASAARLLCSDLQMIATRHASVVSAAAFGALCGAGVLPFERACFEAAIRAGALGVEASLGAFDDALRNTHEYTGEKSESAVSTDTSLQGGSGRDRTEYDKAGRRIDEHFPSTCRDWVRRGYNRVVDYQDVAYGRRFLATVEALHQRDVESNGAKFGYEFTSELAKHLAIAMTWQDVIRVADLKTRADRFDRIQAEAGATREQIITVTEYLHPGEEEIHGLLPAGIARRYPPESRVVRALTRLLGGSRRTRSESLSGFIGLYLLAGLRWYRPHTFRHEQEWQQIDTWLQTVKRLMNGDLRLALEAVRARRLIKGYSDTLARTSGKYHQVLTAIESLVGQPDGADIASHLIDAASLDAEGVALDRALAQLRSATDPDAAAA